MFKLIETVKEKKKEDTLTKSFRFSTEYLQNCYFHYFCIIRWMHGTMLVIGEFQLVLNAFQHVFSRFHTFMIQFSSNLCMKNRHAISGLKFVTDDKCFCCIIHERGWRIPFFDLFFWYRSCFVLVWNST